MDSKPEMTAKDRAKFIDIQVTKFGKRGSSNGINKIRSFIAGQIKESEESAEERGYWRGATGKELLQEAHVQTKVKPCARCKRRKWLEKYVYCRLCRSAIQ